MLDMITINDQNVEFYYLFSKMCIKRGNFIATHHILTAAFVFNSAIEK